MLFSLFPIGGLIAGIITIIAGIIILVWPRIIAYIIGAYLIMVGLFTAILYSDNSQRGGKEVTKTANRLACNRFPQYTLSEVEKCRMVGQVPL